MLNYSPYSFSKINVFNTCPSKFKFKYIDRVEPEPGDMTALLKGGAVHHILEHYPEQSTHSLAPKYQHIVENFAKTELGQNYLNERAMKEFRFGLSQDLKPTNFFDKKALFRGSVDYVCVKNNILYLVDFKTGKLKDIKFQNFDQLMFYSIYFFKRYEKVSTIEISYVYVEHPEYENSVQLNRNYIDQYTDSLLSKIQEIEKSDKFPKTPGKLCDWCEHYKHCGQKI